MLLKYTLPLVPLGLIDSLKRNTKIQKLHKEPFNNICLSLYFISCGHLSFVPASFSY